MHGIIVMRNIAAKKRRKLSACAFNHLSYSSITVNTVHCNCSNHFTVHSKLNHNKENKHIYCDTVQCSYSGVSEDLCLAGCDSVVGGTVADVSKVTDEIIFNVKTPQKTASGLALLLDCFTSKMKTLCAFGTPTTAHPVALSHPRRHDS